MMQSRTNTHSSGHDALLASVLAKHETTNKPSIDRSDDAADIAQRVKAIAQALDRGTYKLVILLPTFDRQKCWEQDGQRSCVAWLNAYCGMSPSAGNDRLRSAYALEKLPIIRQLFELGELSWSKVRALTRIATPENERSLASDALHISASEIERTVREFRNVTTASDIDEENEKAKAHYEKRCLSYRFDESGMVRINASLPPLEGAAVLKSLARAEDVLFLDSHGRLDSSGRRIVEAGYEHEDAAQLSPTQLRADALSLMAMKHLATEEVDVKTADRYQVVVHMDAAVLHQSPDNPDPKCDCRTTQPPAQPLKCYIENGPTIAASAAKRLIDDCSVLPLVMKHGEPLSIGRKSRIWPAAISRAIHARDCHCQFPGCSATRHLHLHHLKHWADGGETSVDGGVALCGFHHRLIHERRYSVEKTALNENGQLPSRTITVNRTDGQSMEFTAPMRRFKVRRPDGSLLG